MKGRAESKVNLEGTGSGYTGRRKSRGETYGKERVYGGGATGMDWLQRTLLRRGVKNGTKGRIILVEE